MFIYSLFCVGRMEFDETGRPTTDQIFLNFMGFFPQKTGKIQVGFGLVRVGVFEGNKLTKTIRTNGKSKDLTITTNPPQEYIVCDGLGQINKISRSERIPHAGSYWLFVMVFSPFKLKVTYCLSPKCNKLYCTF